MTTLTIEWEGEVPDGCEPVLEWRTVSKGDLVANQDGSVENWRGLIGLPRLCFRRKLRKYCPYCGRETQNFYMCDSCGREGGFPWLDGLAAKATPSHIQPSSSPPSTLLPKPWVKPKQPEVGTFWYGPDENAMYEVLAVYADSIDFRYYQKDNGARGNVTFGDMGLLQPWTPKAGERVWINFASDDVGYGKPGYAKFLRTDQDGDWWVSPECQDCMSDMWKGTEELCVGNSSAIPAAFAPPAPAESPTLPDGWELAEPEKRVPKRGEYYVSGRIGDVIFATNDSETDKQTDEGRRWIIRRKPTPLTLEQRVAALEAKINNARPPKGSD